MDPTTRPGEQNVEPTKAGLLFSWGSKVDKLLALGVYTRTEEFRVHTGNREQSNSGEGMASKSWNRLIRPTAKTHHNSVLYLFDYSCYLIGSDIEDGPNSKTSDAVPALTASLPNDSIVEILSRVPAPSIHRFKCVSKAWCDLIADPLHRKRLPVP
ncbi:hypothetical protein BAE44_0014690 [Dichanthelium oligosanthes]|uniref:F-box domain-containing protein n=1 Tax=Dichanthelium oligosanthes TaxID=888268 RepID=A0A1E5VGP9_9POAL|nr:hypothetical protein BAE44_0014690 [Dichanthelium oligosanthes]